MTLKNKNSSFHITTSIFFSSVLDSKMDAESLLLVTSPTVSTISSFDQNESQQYSNNQLSNDSSSVTIDNLTFKKIKNTDIIIKPVSGYFQQPRKPEFRIRPPYLMICISIIEVNIIF